MIPPKFFKGLLTLLLLLLISNANAQTPPSLGAASNYGLLASDSIIVTDTIHVNGDAGAANYVHSKVVAENIYSSVSSAQAALSNAQSYCSGLSSTSISGTLDGQTLTAGVYTVTGNASLTDTLILSGDTTDIFIINVTGNLTFDTSAVILTGDFFFGVRPNNVYWNIGGNLILGPNSSITGVFLTGGDIKIENTFAGYLCLLSQQTINVNGLQNIDPYSYGYTVASYDLLRITRACTGLGIYICENRIDNGSFEYIDPSIGGCPMSISGGGDEWGMSLVVYSGWNRR
ncbi:MAG TPA: ice-binding family protein [Flavobacteriales bacterium]|nr:ice-binding family protein [Flavobacteriales bacterium]